MTLLHDAGLPVAETADDVADWLRALPDIPALHRTETLRCDDEAHGDDPPTWCYVEADRSAGVARTRCLAGGHVRHVADSEQRWSFPSAWSCGSCRQMIAEVVCGVHEGGEEPDWLVLAARCVECGHVSGLTDLYVDRLSV